MISPAGTVQPGITHGADAPAARTCGRDGREAQWVVGGGVARSRVGPPTLRRPQAADRIGCGRSQQVGSGARLSAGAGSQSLADVLRGREPHNVR